MNRGHEGETDVDFRSLEDALVEVFGCISLARNVFRLDSSRDRGAAALPMMLENSPKMMARVA